MSHPPPPAPPKAGLREKALHGAALVVLVVGT
jgi:hypothetical protein